MRIVQITDLHLRHHLYGTAAINVRRSREMRGRLGEALETARRLRPDLLVVTGDLLDVPLWLVGPRWGLTTDDSGPWLAALEADYRLVKKLLDRSGLRYVVLGGNHDLPEVMWRVFERGEDVLDLAGHRIVRFCDEEYECHVPRRFLKERERFDAVLASGDSLPQIHLQHYVLTPALNQGYPHTYGEGEELSGRIVNSGKVRLCLSGHYHPGAPLGRQRDTFFSVAPAFCQWPFPFRVYDIGGDGRVSMAEEALEAVRPAARPVIFLDRDGVINDRASYRTGPEDMRLIKGSGEAIGRLNAAGFTVVVITAQSAIGCGYVPEALVVGVNDKMHRLIADKGGHLDAIYFSASTGDNGIFPIYRNGPDRKPSPALLLRAAEELNLSLNESWMIGDSLKDIQAGLAAGVRPMLVRTGHGARTESEGRDLPENLLVADDLAGAVDAILTAGMPGG